MESLDLNQVFELLKLPEYIGASDFKNVVAKYLERKADKRLAIEELDRNLSLLQGHLSTFSLYIKQNHLLCRIDADVKHNVEFYTKQEIAAKYRVSVRTVSNWIIDGLEAEEIGGVIRISSLALKAFVSTKKRKKFNWKSIVRA
jgi:hypothetical protein